MPDLNWDKFDELPGDSTANFELLWRGAIRQTYGRYGDFQARAQQPGVEFHIHLNQDCGLGEAGRWFGWQTKWWKVSSGTAIGTNRRDDVEDSQAKTAMHLPDLTDWVLCTRRPFTPKDQAWFSSLTPGFKLDHQVSEDLANLLVGDVELLRETYFGDLVINAARLEELQESAVSEVRERWFPEVHQSTSVELALRQMLAEPDAWNDLDHIGHELKSLVQRVDGTVGQVAIPANLADDLADLVERAFNVRQLLAEVYERLSPDGDHTWRELGDAVIPTPPPATPPVLRKLRAENHPAAPPLTNLVFRTREAISLANQVFDRLAAQIVVVTGDAGFGKTHLAARLTTATEARPAGVLLYGRRLSDRDDLDQLARQVTLAGKPVQTFDALLAAVDAAAARAQCRLPIVVDGLNEAENPGDWRPLLDKLQKKLEKYPSVLVICTIRETFVPRAIPTSIDRVLPLDGFTVELSEVVKKYFEYFKIDAPRTELPRDLFRQPLALRIFCTVANPSREETVVLAHLPRSLNEMFGTYLAEVADRIEDLNPQLRASEVLEALDALGLELWKEGTRELPEARVKEIFGDLTRARWDGSILAALENEGVLIRQPAQDAEAPDHTLRPDLVVAVVYDLLAGYLIASATVRHGGNTFVQALKTPEVEGLLANTSATRHQLATDIFDALAFVLPRHNHGQLWQAVGDQFVRPALLRTVALDPASVDDATVETWTNAINNAENTSPYWARLRESRAIPDHPLNTTFLDTILRPMAVSNRDLRWTEWLRSNWQSALADAHAIAADWQNRPERTDADALRARWLLWVLTSTVRDLRDAATAALYWYGRGNSTALFNLALDALTINDPYIGERATAAAYGVATAHQQHDPEFEIQLAEYLTKLVPIVSGDEPTAPTFHRLTRYYIAGTIEFARAHYPHALPPAAADGIDFAPGALPAPIPKGHPSHNDANLTIHMDFGNYTVGRLFRDRGNYDDKHLGHQKAIAQILGVVYDLGWRQEEFLKIDSSIGRRNNDRGPDRIDRYGKKYAWIGFYLVAGELLASGARLHWLETDIDPTFPQRNPQLPFDLPEWIGTTDSSDEQWLLNGTIEVPDDLLYRPTLDGDEGPWVLVHANLSSKDNATGRNTFGLFNTIAVDASQSEDILKHWESISYPGRDLIDLPAAYYLFAGEIPWHPRMVSSGEDMAGTGMKNIPWDPNDGWTDYHNEPHEDPYNSFVRGYHPAPYTDQTDELENLPTEINDLLAKYGGTADDTTPTPPKLPVEPPRKATTLPFEVLAHTFAWEGHNSSENQAFSYVPSKRLSNASNLRSTPASFNQTDPTGAPASKSYAASAGLEGNLLYIREDILKSYASGLAVITVGFGERQLTHSLPNVEVPDAIRKVYQQNLNVWRTHRIVDQGSVPPEKTPPATDD
ncbi:hypothetical protein FE697_003700 [Mumia zhuanghuii]|uniref:NACHT domain-containing protein n=2 Tax=Mumia TaxID=1546255 RepID=A0ABW1QMX7_9ACTN|nr:MULTISPECIES: hypothetical protein [Mumia]KAA1425008.1 hypothetical protein FE697_003700 [Mumia zhuanghuii]